MVAFKPDGWPSVVPRIFASDPAGLVAFLQSVFEGRGEYQPMVPAEVRIGDSIVMVSGAEERGHTPAFLYVYVADADGTYARAVAAGAESLEAPRDLPYGDRRAMVRDRWGNTWQIATHQEDLSPEEIRNRMAP